MKTALHPLFGRVLAKRKTITQVGAIILPKDSGKVGVAEIISVGEECTTLRKGDMVTFGKYSPHFIDNRDLELYGLDMNPLGKDEELLIINEQDILCVLLPDEPDEEVA